jgi:hypothetical protein
MRGVGAFEPRINSASCSTWSGAAAASMVPASAGECPPAFRSGRLHETGLVKSSAQKIITGGTDWRFLDELNHKPKG